MSQKGQQRVFDEFAWIIFAAVGFVLIITIIFTATTSVPVIEPKSVSLTLEKGVSHTFAITVRSEDGRKMTNVTLSSFGETAGWITFDRNRFDVDNSTTVRVKVQVPQTAGLRAHTGGIKVTTSGGSSSMSLSVLVANVSIIPLESRPIFIGDVDVKFAKGSETAATKENIQVTKGAFSESASAFSMNVPVEKLAITTNAYLELFVVDANKKGNLIVTFNGNELHNSVTDTGRLVLPVDKSLMDSTNVVNIRTTGPSLWQFWSKASYKIEKSNLVISFEDTTERERFFELSGAEAENFHHFQLQTRIKEYSTPLQELFIKVNNQVAFAAKPPQVAMNQTIDKDILGNRLVLGDTNKITFSLEKEGTIVLDDVFLVVYFN